MVAGDGQEEMDKFEVQADATSYTIMIETVANAGNFRGRKPPSKRVLEAFELYEEMKERGIAPTTDTYNTLIDGCVSAPAAPPPRRPTAGPPSPLASRRGR